MSKIKIVFADDHAIVRDGLRSLFKSDPQFLLLGEAANGEEALELVAKHKPDVAILDISMPGVNGIEATRIIKRTHPSTKVMILTMHENEQYVHELIQIGADGYVLKNSEKKEIFDGVKAIARGEHFFSSDVSKLLIGGLIKKSRGNMEQHPPGNGDLTEREKEILKLIAEGMTSRQIAAHLSLSVSTINVHRASLKRKLDIHDVAGLVKYALRTNLTDPRVED